MRSIPYVSGDPVYVRICFAGMRPIYCIAVMFPAVMTDTEKIQMIPVYDLSIYFLTIDNVHTGNLPLNLKI